MITFLSIGDKRPRGRDLPRSSSAQIIVRRPNDPFFRIATHSRPSYGLLQTPQAARQSRCHGALTLTLGRFQPPFSGRPPVSDRYPGKLVVLRALRQELVSRLAVPTIYSVEGVKNVENWLSHRDSSENPFPIFAMAKLCRLRVPYRVMLNRGAMLCRRNDGLPR